MAKVMTEETIKAWIAGGKVIEYADAGSAEGIKYDFHLGRMFLKAHFGRPVNFDDLSNEERRHAIIKPGEVVYVLTQEKLTLPDNTFVQLSAKRKMSHLGIQLLGGLTIDPGYKGHLLFGLCNLSSTDFTLMPGKKLVGAVFYELQEGETVEYKIPDPLDDFPEDVTSLIRQYRPVESLMLSEEVKRLSKEMSDITRRLESDAEWKNTFKANIDSITTKLSEISNTLQIEINMRKEGEDSLKKSDEKLGAAVTGINQSISSFKTTIRVLNYIGGVIATLAGLTIAYFSLFMTKDAPPIADPPPATSQPNPTSAQTPTAR